MRRLVLLPVLGLLLAAGLSPCLAADNASIATVQERVARALEAVAAKPSPKVLVVPIREEIELSTAVFVEREMERARDEKFDLVLVDMETPGGRLDAALRIANAFIQQGTAEAKRVPVVSFVNNDAFSAGAIICLATGRIYIAPGGKIGAATGYVLDPQTGLPAKLPEDVQAKFLSAERAEVRALAKVGGHAPGIAEAMVDRSVTLTEYEIDGRREILTDKEFENRKRELNLGGLSPDESSRRVKNVRVICEPGELLTLDYEEAKAVGLAADVLGSREAVFAALGVKAPAVTLSEHNWSEYVFGFLASPGIRLLLLVLGLLGLYVEFKTPGFGAPGVFGILCLALFFFSQYFMGLANYTGIIVFLIGLALLLVELFLIPGFGVTGIVGILLMIAGLFLGMQPWVIPNIQSPFDVQLFMTNVLVMGIAVIVLIVFAVVFAKVLPSMPMLSRLILTSTGPPGELRSSGTMEESEKALVGMRGKALSRLRPAGRAEFAGKILDVVTEGGFLEADTPIEVTKVEGNRVVVRKAE